MSPKPQRMPATGSTNEPAETPQGSTPEEIGPKVTWIPSGRSGTGTVRVDLPDGAFTDSIKIVSDRARTGFLKKIEGRVTAETLEVIQDKLEELAATGTAESGGAEGGGNEKEANRLIDLVLSDPTVELFHVAGDIDMGYATVLIGERLETYRLGWSGFKLWMNERFYRAFGGAPSTQAVTEAIQVLTAKAIFEGPQLRVATRVAFFEDDILIDLGDPQRRVVRITRHSWSVVPNAQVPVRFVRRQGLLPLPVPCAGGSMDLLRPFVNLADEESWILFVGWLVHALYPRGPFGVLIISGEQGSAKSTLARVAQRLVDPNKGGLRRPPKSEQDMMIAASNTWLFALDNLSGLRGDLSDSLCTVATGGGYAARSLFTNEDECIIEVQRPVMLNGIDDLSRRADLLDRSVVLHLPAIREGKRLAEDDFWRDFDAAAPRILGALCDALVSVLQRRDEVHLEAAPRMADFAKTVTAAEPALGWAPLTFVTAYEANRSVASALSLEESETGQAIVKLMAQVPSWRGTSAQLREQLAAYVPPRIGGGPRWSPTNEGLSKELRRLAPVLRKIEIEVRATRDKTRARSRHFVIERAETAGGAGSAGADSSDGLRSVNCPTKSASTGSPGQFMDSSDGSDSFCPNRRERNVCAESEAGDALTHICGSGKNCPNCPNCPQTALAGSPSPISADSSVSANCPTEPGDRPSGAPRTPCFSCRGGSWWRLRDTGCGEPGDWMCANCRRPTVPEDGIDRAGTHEVRP
jgi:hypothetical protein